jgi:uncharacterized membrane protein YedE/YeeE
MYGILGSGVVTASALIALFRRLGIRTADGTQMRIEPRSWQPWANAVGGLIFGLGWGLLGACPGPIYALLGSGVTVMVVALASALLGAWTYGQLKPRLPHRKPLVVASPSRSQPRRLPMAFKAGSVMRSRSGSRSLPSAERPMRP